MARLSYLLDTNVLSVPLAKMPNPGVVQNLEAHASKLALASVTWQELLFGMQLLEPGRRRAQIQDYLVSRVQPCLPILPFDTEAATWQATESARLRRLGQPPAYADAQIAAIAATNGLVLVTRNLRDFRAFDGLVLENWFTPS
ncbi:PIN domain-containing protein [Thiorhodovibrio frisius]|uniref:Ribonuclease VapC n=1 Tax=Thiorhodovibrio frisius TaxID=631362 RepID=H8Z488_9GAMM|nr:PIN domain-containing protein [Thiorhodovibrio frisius]EIC20145.1 putative nucleic acid-binding protein [Thiorhodovibrio frisius]WPL20883.1 tRNA(fMet)-specific endonuclease VapC [Thiorhodovibrio frisius]